MPNVRGKGQKGVLVMMREEFLASIDAALPKAGYSDRAKFVRDSVYEKLLRMGYKIPVELPTAPARKGKGGRPTHSKVIASAATTPEQNLRVADAESPTTEKRKSVRYKKAKRSRTPGRTKEV